MGPLTNPHTSSAGSAPSPRSSSDTSAALKAFPTPSQASPNTFASRRPFTRPGTLRSSRASLDWSVPSTRPTEMGKNYAVDLLFTLSGLMARAELTNESTDLKRIDCLRCSCSLSLLSCPSCPSRLKSRSKASLLPVPLRPGAWIIRKGRAMQVTT